MASNQKAMRYKFYQQKLAKKKSAKPNIGTQKVSEKRYKIKDFKVSKSAALFKNYHHPILWSRPFRG